MVPATFVTAKPTGCMRSAPAKSETGLLGATNTTT